MLGFPIAPVGPRPPNQSWVNTFSQRRYSSDMVGLPIVGLGAADPVREQRIASLLAQLQKCMSPGDYAVKLTETQQKLYAAQFGTYDTRNPGNVTYDGIEMDLAHEIQFWCAPTPTLLYVGIGLGAVALVGGAWWLLKRKH